jgi:hypothetical protein
MAFANFKIRKETKSSFIITLSSIIGLSLGAILILYSEFKSYPKQLVFILLIYILLTVFAWGYVRFSKKLTKI